MRPLIAVPAYPVKAGRIQGWEKPGVAAPTPYVTQWHPEDTAADDPAHQRLFDAFVRRASER